MEQDNQLHAVRMPDLSERIYQVAATDVPISLHGPKESGKEWVAEALHDFSGRSGKPFLIVDCQLAADRSPMIDIRYPVKRDFRELMQFAERGLCEGLKGGTVWINNLAELPERDQQQLLSKLQRQFECRVIDNVNRMYTKKPLDMEPRESVLQESVTIMVPPLRQQPKNIQFFANYFLAKVNIEWTRQIPGFSDETMQVLTNYPWPGNLSELRDVVCQSVLVAVDGESLPAVVLPSSVREYHSLDPLFLKKAVLKAEYDLICKTLSETKNNKRKAAEILKISRKTLYSKMRIFQTGKAS